MNFELKIVNIIKAQEAKLTKLEYIKKTSPRISEEKEAFMSIERKKSYIKGLRDALTLIQSKE